MSVSLCFTPMFPLLDTCYNHYFNQTLNCDFVVSSLKLLPTMTMICIRKQGPKTSNKQNFNSMCAFGLRVSNHNKKGYLWTKEELWEAALDEYA